MRVFGRELTWSRFPATRAMGRLGIIASVISGAAVAFHLGGRDGFSLVLGYLLGAPTNVFILQLLNAISPIPHNVIWSGADWNVYLLLFCVCIAVNWTMLGLLADLLAPRPAKPTSSTLVANDAMELMTGDVDPLVHEFEKLEREVRERRKADDRLARRAA
jgi:hypothetical protein